MPTSVVQIKNNLVSMEGVNIMRWESGGGVPCRIQERCILLLDKDNGGEQMTKELYDPSGRQRWQGSPDSV